MKLVLGVFVNLFNLLLNPIGWLRYLKKINVDSDFHLLNLSWQDFRHHEGIKKLLLQTFVIIPLIAGVVAVMGVSLQGKRTPYILFFSFLLAVSYAFSTALTTSWFINFGAAQVYGLALGIGMGLLADDPSFIYFSYAASTGLVGLVLLNLSESDIKSSYVKSYVVSFISGVIAVGTVLGLWFFIFSGKVINERFTSFGEYQLHVPDILLLFITTFMIVTIVLFFGNFLRNYNRKMSLRRLLVGSLIPASITTLAGVLFITSNPLSLKYVLTAGFGGGTLFAILISLPWILFNRTKLNNAFIVASTFTIGLGWIFLGPMIAPGFEFNLSLFFVSILLIAAGLTFDIWFPVVSFPLVVLFNRILYLLDTRNRQHSFYFFKYHAVFWFDKVKFPWFGLDQHLVKMVEYQPEFAYKKMSEISKTNQRWAVRKALLILSYRELLGCNSLEEIAELKPALIHIPDATLAFTNQFLRFARDIKVALAYQSPYHIRVALVRVRDDLITVERSLMMAEEKRLFRFLAVTSHWMTLIEQRLTEMATKKHNVDEIFNPYVCGIPLNENQELFVGRMDIFERIERLILNEQRPPLLLYGQRRMGKTSLLLNLGRILPDAIIPMYIDSQALGGVLDFSELFYGMVQQMNLAASRYRNLILPTIQLDSLKESPFLAFLEWILELDLYLVQNNKIALWLIDEFETFNHWAEMKAVNIQELLNLFRHVVQHHPNIKVLFSGTHHLSEMESWAGSLVNTQVIKIGCLKPEEAETLIQRPTRNFNLTYPQFVLDWILDLTGGHPHLIQLFCYELILLKNEQPTSQRLNVTMDDLEETYYRATKGGEFFFIDIYQNQIKPEMKNAFVFLAKNSNQETGLSRETWQMGIPEVLEKVITVGLQRDLIQKNTDGLYTFQIEWIRRWFMEQKVV
jgi:hypothetical protein